MYGLFRLQEKKNPVKRERKGRVGAGKLLQWSKMRNSNWNEKWN